MKFNKAAGERGLIKAIVIIVIAILIISYLGIDLRALVSSPTTQDNVSYVATTTVHIWNNYLKVPVTYAWNLFIEYVWKTAIASLQKGGSPGVTPPAGQKTPCLVGTC